MTVFLQAVANGVMLGGVYAAAGVGLSLIFGVTGIVNAAHGELMMLGAFTTYWLARSHGVDPLLSLPVAFLLLFAFGYGLQRFVLNRSVGAPLLVSLLATFGLSLVLVNAALRLWSADYRVLSVPYLDRSLHLGEVVLPYTRLVAGGLGLLMVAGLSALLARTPLGRAMRATAQDWEMAQLAGIDTRRVFALTVAIGVGVTGAAGSLVAYFTNIHPYMGLSYTLFAFAVVVLGGMGYIPGVLYGGLAIGLAQAFTETYLEAGLSFMVAFLLLYVMLSLRPAGITGRGRVE